MKFHTLIAVNAKTDLSNALQDSFPQKILLEKNHSMNQHSTNVEPMDSKNQQKDVQNESKNTGDQAKNQINFY
jgi:hypothetical protein